jgi:NAD(P)-dependent dehydrogenase (short-subunit alcohol dehydrogenase family)
VEFDFDGKVAIVTGGSSGLGRATVTALGAAGAKVLVVDVDESAGAEVARAVNGAFHKADVSSLSANKEMVKTATGAFGGVDLVYLNAGLATRCGIGEDFDEDRYRLVMGVNLDGVVFGTHAVLPALDARGGGAIVATASLAGLTGIPYDPLYSANKHAVVGLARSLGPALADRKIRYNAVCPGFSQSKIIEPFKAAIAAMNVPIIAAEQVAEAVLTLFAGEMTGEAWFVQAGRQSEAFGFRGIPGPRSPEV